MFTVTLDRIPLGPTRRIVYSPSCVGLKTEAVGFAGRSFISFKTTSS
jgi:hypothetical protein